MKYKTLILGYGNPDRGDDGVALFILNHLIAQKRHTPINLLETGFSILNESIDLWYNLQLVPEISEILAKYQRAVFIDAHTGKIQEDLKISEIKPYYQNSPLTHHSTPASCLSLAQGLFGSAPKSILVSVRGYQFNFTNNLSNKTKGLAIKASEYILNWINTLNE
ncbi:MAG TPA: hypothetical protein G4N92_00400 [Anaerolineae bacterium]|nr:hypothetical protein [Anaerolineae bacterium]